jgi:TolB-like protein/DNA-binding winged helix-turn-helix (wHTH) protein/Flp pilus assembly protein TadD
MDEPVQSGVVVRFGVFELDGQAHELRKNGIRLRLQGQPLEVLRLLVERAGEVVTREELRQRLWPADTFVDFDHSVNNAVARIREALGDSSDAPRFIATVPRRGYKFLAPVELRPSWPAYRSATPAVIARTRLRGWTLFVAFTAAIAVAGGIFSTWRGTRAQARPYRIAVLPIKNLSPEPDRDYFSDGLTDQIIYNLSIIDGLEVKSRTSSFQFKGKTSNVRNVGRDLQADLVLEGTVVRDAERLRLTIALVRVADDTTLWSNRYDRLMADVFAIQDDISRSIANELRLRGIGGQRRHDTNLGAYDLYLRALSLSNESAPGQGQERGLQVERAIELFRQATTEDRQFAPAYAATAEAWANLRNRGRSRESTERMREAALKAIELDPLLPDARATLGLVRATDLQWQDAESEFRRALELNPNSARTHADFARFVLLPEERTGEALAHLRRALALDPLSPSRRIQLAYALLRAGDYEKAQDLTEPIFAADPADYFAGQLTARALMHQGRLDPAVTILEKLPKQSGSDQYLGYAYAMMGRRNDAEALAAEPDPAAPRHQLVIYTALGDHERAFVALHAMVQANDWAVDVYPGDPELAPLRNDPRMKEFRHQRGLLANP